ncbi:MAG TPA: FAD-dependent oxidoreductase [Trebonia sp.]|nr:FAD-dependent oxidoreductase [Trebonia sp.]
MTETADAVVIGAGVIGSSVALELSRLGLGVTVVDKAGGPGFGSTSASSAIVRFNYSTQDGVAAAWESRHCWEHWADHLEAGESADLAAFTRTGMIMLDVPVMPAGQVTALFDAVGVPYERWDARTLASRVPGIDTGRFWPPKQVGSEAFFAPPDGELGGLFTPDAGFVNDPQLAARNLAAAAQAHGARLKFGAAVIGIGSSSERVRGVALADGTVIDAPVVVNAAGPWSSRVNELADVGADFTIRTRPLRQEVHYVTAPAGYGTGGQLGSAIADLDLGTYLRPAFGNGFLIGGTEPECDPLEWVEDPDTVWPHVTAERFEAQVTRAARRLTGLTVPTAPKGVVGVYDAADDWTPIYDRTALGGFYVAIGTSGNQFKNAPVAGRFLAAIIAAVEAGHDHDADPVRYHCPHTGNQVNLGAFSRRRPANGKTSGTVMG